jgi:hypothetical protein
LLASLSDISTSLSDLLASLSVMAAPESMSDGSALSKYHRCGTRRIVKIVGGRGPNIHKTNIKAR